MPRKTEVLPLQKCRPHPIFLDCGAYGFYQRKLPFPFKRYLSFVVREHQNCSHIALPDVIGDAEASYNNYRRFLEELDKLNLLSQLRHKLIWTYHLPAKQPRLAYKMADLAKDYGLRWMAGGGVVGLDNLQAKLQFSYFLRQIKEKYGFKLHYWGVFHQEMLVIAQADSADTSAPFTSIRSAVYFSFHSNTLVRRRVAINSRSSYLMRYDSINAFLLYEHFLISSKLLPPHFKFFFVPGSTPSAPPWICSVLKKRCLVSFFDFL